MTGESGANVYILDEVKPIIDRCLRLILEAENKNREAENKKKAENKLPLFPISREGFDTFRNDDRSGQCYECPAIAKMNNLLGPRKENISCAKKTKFDGLIRCLKHHLEKIKDQESVDLLEQLTDNEKLIERRQLVQEKPVQPVNPTHPGSPSYITTIHRDANNTVIFNGSNNTNALGASNSERKQEIKLLRNELNQLQPAQLLKLILLLDAPRAVMDQAAEDHEKGVNSLVAWAKDPGSVGLAELRQELEELLSLPEPRS